MFPVTQSDNTFNDYVSPRLRPGRGAQVRRQSGSRGSASAGRALLQAGLAG